MKTFETEKHNIPEGATHYRDEVLGMRFLWASSIGEYWFTWNGFEWCEADKAFGVVGNIKPIPQQEVEWEDTDELPPIGSKVMTSYTDSDLDNWCDMHGPSDVVAYHGEHVWIAHHGKFNRVHALSDIEFEKIEIESPEEKEKRERLEAAYDLYVTGQESVDVIGYQDFDDFTKDLMQVKFYNSIVDKTGYRLND